MKICCFQYVKDTKKKANHNSANNCYQSKYVVSNTSKIQKRKQITTDQMRLCKKESLFPIRQRYKKESKSQLHPQRGDYGLGCFQYVKDTKKKANHNFSMKNIRFCCVVSNTSKIQKRKQITTVTDQEGTEERLFPIRQRYKKESKSQRQRIDILRMIRCFQYVKDTKKKANHNHPQ